MRTIAIMNLKGGVAKTTTTVNVAAILARDHKKRVLVVDADSQCNTTEFFGADPESGNLARALKISWGGELFAVQQIQRTDRDGVDILPGSEELMDLGLSGVEDKAVDAEILRKLVRELEVVDRYDFCLIDCPPAFNAASAAALLAAGEVLIPIKLDAFSLRGMTNLMRQIYNMQEINPALELLGFLPTMWYPCRYTHDAEKTLRDGGYTVLPHIRRTDKADAMTFDQRPLIETSPRCAAAVDYRRLVRELLKGGGGNG